MLQVVQLTKCYKKTLAVDNVSFYVKEGQIGVLLGPNGAGKSTIIKSIAGLLRYQGEVLIDGILSKEKAAKSRFAYVPEMPAMYQNLTVEEHIDFMARGYGITDYEQQKQYLLERFELSDKVKKLGSELSKGMMQKVSICCALITRPSVILLDEPMVGLDPKAIKTLKEELLKMRDAGMTVLISTHMLDMVRDLWDAVFVMDQGHFIGSFSREEIERQNSDIEELYFKITEKNAAAGIPGMLGGGIGNAQWIRED